MVCRWSCLRSARTRLLATAFLVLVATPLCRDVRVESIVQGFECEMFAPGLVALNASR